MSCPHGYPKPSMCLDCMEDGPVGDPWEKDGPPFTAHYDGTCAGCRAPIVAGITIIQRWRRGAGMAAEQVYTCGACRP